MMLQSYKLIVFDVFNSKILHLNHFSLLHTIFILLSDSLD